MSGATQAQRKARLLNGHLAAAMADARCGGWNSAEAAAMFAAELAQIDERTRSTASHCGALAEVILADQTLGYWGHAVDAVAGSRLRQSAG